MWCFPTGPRQALVTACLFAAGTALFAAGAHLSYVNVEPQRARTIARDNLLREYLRKKYGYGGK